MDPDEVARLGACPTPVSRAAMVHWWDELTFLHWPYPADEVQRLLPAGLEVETSDGMAWVGLVPFFLRVGLPGVRPVRWLSQFAETNVRTYVRGSDGRSGIWFFSLDAARLGAVLIARATYRLPYFWSRMQLERDGSSIRYECTRRWPGPRGARSSLAIDIGDPFAPGELTPLDHFLTARWALYSSPRSGLHHGLKKPSLVAGQPEVLGEPDAASMNEIGGEGNSGHQPARDTIDSEILSNGMELAVFHIEAGMRTFAAYAKAMVNDLGDVAKPYLKSWYMGVKFDPGATAFEGMDSAASVESADVDAIFTEESPNAET
jgi:uncharacterized protein YqjF (DUF2071 family)